MEILSKRRKNKQCLFYYFETLIDDFFKTDKFVSMKIIILRHMTSLLQDSNNYDL